MIERFFAETILKKEACYTADTALCLEKLMRCFRSGDLCVQKECVGEAIDLLPSTIVEEGHVLFPKAPIIRNEDRYYLQKNWVYETHILNHVKRLRKQQPPSYFDRTIFEEGLVELLNSGKLFLKQGEAVRSVLAQGLSIICGGPGTGKTYTASHLVRLLFSSLRRGEKRNFRLCLTAPTGKAAFHLRTALKLQDSALHIEASTLHRLLKLQPGHGRLFSKRSIDADLVIVDEASMIDMSLLAHLLEAIGEETMLVLIGDPDQLPPVEAASLFSEMGALFGTILDRCIRTEEDHLQKLAQSVREGNVDLFNQLLDVGHESGSRLEWSFDSLLCDKLYEQIQPIISDTQPDPEEAFTHYGRCRILNAMRQGCCGADSLNLQIFRKLQSSGRWWAAPILAIVNDPYADLYNGMSGILVGRDPTEAVAYFPNPSSGGYRSFSSPPPYELAFCLSIHKSQGSEFERVLSLFPDGSENFGREALYTAITRAKKKIAILSSQEILGKMISITSHRKSGFKVRYSAPGC